MARRVGVFRADENGGVRLNTQSRIRPFHTAVLDAPEEYRSPLDVAEDSNEESGQSKFRAKVRKKIEGSRFDHTRVVTKPPEVFRLSGKIIATKGNVIILKGPEKCGKSSVLGAALAATISNGSEEADTLGFTTSNPAGHMVLHIDCEQSNYHHDQMLRKVMKRALVTEPPAWLHSYALRGLSPDEFMIAIKDLMAEGAATHGGIHSVWIDGFSDLLIDVNDTKTVAPLVADLMAMSKEFDTAIFGVIHQNPSPDTNSASKARGVLGSELQRKVETALVVQRDGEGFEIRTDMARNAPIVAGEGTRYAWCSTWEMFRTDYLARAARTEVRKEELSIIARRLLPNGAKLGYTKLVGAIERDTACSNGKAKTLHREMVTLGVIKKAEDKDYTLAVA